MHLIIPKQKELIVPVQNPERAGNIGRLAARIMIEKAKCDSEGNELEGTRHVVAPWFKNTVTDAGLDRKGMDGGISAECVIGTGTSPILPTSTHLGNAVAGQSSLVSRTNGMSATSPYYGWTRGVHRFNAGVATGTLSEVGLTCQPISTDATKAIAMGSLIKDNLGNPTTITKAADELLDITYEVRLYAKTTDDVYVVNINGIDYTFTTRARFVSSGGWDQYNIFGRISDFTFSRYNTNDQLSTGVTTANLGAINAEIGGTFLLNINHDAGRAAYPAYINGTKYGEVRYTIGPADGNTGLGITGITTETGAGAFKTAISPAIPKSVGSTLVLRARWYWDRYTI